MRRSPGDHQVVLVRVRMRGDAMSEVYTTGTWTPNAGEADAFVEAWLEFARWASQAPGAGSLRLARDARDQERFVSFGRWDNIEAAHAWKSSPEFRERMGRVQRHVDQFAPAELEVVATVEAGTVAA
jgi:heme-degrading monooxygenase HmoA